MDHPNMDLPKPAEFEDCGRRIRPKITLERLSVLGLLLVGGAFLGLAAEFWPQGGFQNLLAPFQLAGQETPEDLQQQIQDSLRAGDVRQALALCARLVEMDPEQGRFLRARLLIALSEYDKAADDLAKVIEINSQNTDAYALRARVNLLRKDNEAAVQDADRLIQVQSRDGHLLRGEIFAQLKDYDKALADFDAAIKEDAEYRDAYVGRFQVLLEKGEYDKALKDAEKIGETKPSTGHVLRGDVYAKQKNYDESIKAYTAAIEADPKNATAYNNRAYHKALARRDLDSAQEDVSLAIELAGEEPAYIDTRGFVAYLQGQFKAALGDFDEALEGAEDSISQEFYAEIYFHRGLVYRKLGEDKLAEEDFAKAKQLGFEWTEIPEPLAKEL